MILTNNWWEDIQDEETYNKLVGTGLAWEWYESLPLTWKECLDFKKKHEYYEANKESNYTASLKIMEWEEKHVRSIN